MPVGIDIPLISSSLIPSSCLISVLSVFACDTTRHLFPARRAGVITELKKGIILAAVSFSDSVLEPSNCCFDSLRYLHPMRTLREYCNSQKHYARVSCSERSRLYVESHELLLPSIISVPIRMVILHYWWSNIVTTSHLHHKLLIEMEFFICGIFVVSLKSSIMPFI